MLTDLAIATASQTRHGNTWGEWFAFFAIEAAVFGWLALWKRSTRSSPPATWRGDPISYTNRYIYPLSAVLCALSIVAALAVALRHLLV